MTFGFQVDAVPDRPSAPQNLQQKLDQELNYHKHGSYIPEQSPTHASYLHPSPAAQLAPSATWGTDLPQQVSSVQSWSSKPYPSPHEAFDSQMSMPLSQAGPYQQSKPLERVQSWPPDLLPQPETGTQARCWMRLGVMFHLYKPLPNCYRSCDRERSSCCGVLGGSLYISQASGIQIGNNNTMHFRSTDSSSLNSQSSTSSSNTKYKELLLKYGEHAPPWLHYICNKYNIKKYSHSKVSTICIIVNILLWEFTFLYFRLLFMFYIFI